MTENEKQKILIAFGNRIRKLRTEKQMSQDELAKKSGYNSENARSSIQKIEAGKSDIPASKIKSLAKALDVPVSEIMGWADEPYNEITVNNIFCIETKKFPLLGNIACGEPIFANEEQELYVEAGANIDADFCLKAKGDSMIGARIQDGDIVFIRKQSTVEDGEIAAVLIDDEATLKRFYYDRENSTVQLFAENPKYKALRFSGEEISQIRVLGKAVAFQSDIR